MRNLVASVRDRLHRTAQSRGDTLQQVLTQYARERWLYRLAQSPHAPVFQVKGAALLEAWAGPRLPYRATKDLDLRGSGDPGATRIGSLIADIAGQEVEPDGVTFDPNAVVTSPIRAKLPYGGVRAIVHGTLGTIRLRVQIDVGFGDPVTDGPVRTVFPTLLPDTPAPVLSTYNAPTIVAEKTAALTDLGFDNTRMKDFFDLSWLSQNHEFDGPEVLRAVERTFRTRRIALPRGVPEGLTDAFGTRPDKQQQWAAWRRKTRLEEAPEALVDVVQTARAMLGPVFADPATAPPLGRWVPGSGWTPSKERTRDAPKGREPSDDVDLDP